MPSEMNDWDVQVAARLTSHEFMLEILYANWFAQLAPDAAEAVADEILMKTRNAYTAADVDQEAAEAVGSKIVEDSSAMTQRFFQKVIERADQIRDRRQG